MIDITKCKRRDGGEFVIYTTEGKDPHYPIVGEYKAGDGSGWGLASWGADGKFYNDTVVPHVLDLIEVTPYDHIKPGDLVMVWRSIPEDAIMRIFAGVATDGRPLVYWPKGGINPWDDCLTVEEYADKYLLTAAKENTDD